MSDDERKGRADLLYGAPRIAEYLDMTERQARYLIDKGTLPSFKIDGKVCASRNVVDGWLADKQAEGRCEVARQVAEREQSRQVDADAQAATAARMAGHGAR